MMRSSASSALQKTYDECFFTCSTAVYFESQNNEAEALRAWKTALDRIYQYNATRGSAFLYQPTTETDRTLQESLHQLELQCRERVDLLEALQQSREEAGQAGVPVNEGPEAGLGGGTVPAVNYADLSRPPLPGRRTSEPPQPPARPHPRSSSQHSLSPAPTMRSTEARTPSPEKKGRMLRTLRKEPSRPSNHRVPSSSSSRPPVAAKAATLAFNTSATYKTGRPACQANGGSNESLPVPASHETRTRHSFDRPRTAQSSRSVLASAAAAQSYSDLRTERNPSYSAQSPLHMNHPPLTHNSRVRTPTKTQPPMEVVAVDANDNEETERERAKQLPQRRAKARPRRNTVRAELPDTPTSDHHTERAESEAGSSEPEFDEWKERVQHIMKHLPRGVDESAARQLLNEIVIQGDEVHWDDVAGLEVAKSALKETVVYPFLRPDLFMGLREPARGMLLFGPPGTGKTMLARAVATESKSTFFAISASSLTSKFLGESEKLVRALFALAKMLAPSIIFVDEIDSLLSSRSGAGEHEATRRIKTEFLIQWSDLAKAAAGREASSEKERERGDASRVLVLAATNLPWAIDDAARRRFVRRQYIPLPEGWVRKQQLTTLLSHQKHEIGEAEMDKLVAVTEGFSGSDITALAKDAAMGPLRSLGEKVLELRPEEIRPIRFEDFQASLLTIRPSVSRQGLKQYEDWAKEFGERGG